MNTLSVSRDTLLSLAHLVYYGLSFNRVNAQLDEIQSRHFIEAGKDISAIRDLFVPYDDGKEAQQHLFSLCDAQDEHDVIRLLNDKDKHNPIIEIKQQWAIETINHAITRYNERCRFFMMEHEYEEDLIKHLGEAGAMSFKLEVKTFLGKKMVCGNACRAEREMRNLLDTLGSPYEKPPSPYMDKWKERFKHWTQALNKSKD